MPQGLDKAQFLARLDPLLTAAGMSRVYPEARDPAAYAASLALAGLPHYDDLWAGDLGEVVALIAVASGARLTGADLVRRAEMLADRVAGPVQALQLVVYERPVPAQEREFVLDQARKAGVFPLARARVATWVFALGELALHATRFPGWPAQLGSTEQLALLAGQLLRHLDGDAHVLVAALVAVQAGDPLALEPEHLPALRSRGDLHLHLAVERRDADLGPQRGLREADRDLADDLGILADEDGVLLHVDHDVQVARRAAPLAGLALARQLEARAGVDARRHLHAEHALVLDLARALARLARVGDHLAGPLAMAARPRDLEEPLREPQLARAVAGRALLGPRSGLRSRATARVAALVPRDLHLRLGAEGGFGEADLQVVAEVGPAAARGPAAASAAAEDVAEDPLEDVVDVRAAESLVERAGAEPAGGLVAEAVVAGALLRVGEHLVRLGDLLELLLGLLVAFVLVGVELDGELAEGALQLLRGAGPFDAEHFVVVVLGVGLHEGSTSRRKASKAGRPAGSPTGQT